MPDSPLPAHVPAITVACPECGAHVDIPIDVTITGDAGGQRIQCDPDLTDVWAHAWTHDQPELKGQS